MRFLNFELKSAPKKPVEVEIVDAKGNLVHKMTAPGHEGMNRIAWNLHYDPPRMIALRTVPEEDPHIWQEGRFCGDGFAAGHSLGDGASAHSAGGAGQLRSTAQR